MSKDGGLLDFLEKCEIVDFRECPMVRDVAYTPICHEISAHEPEDSRNLSYDLYAVERDGTCDSEILPRAGVEALEGDTSEFLFSFHRNIKRFLC